MKVTCEIKEHSDPAKENVVIHNHWRCGDFVEIEFDGKTYVVDGNELKRAIDNCMNTGL